MEELHDRVAYRIVVAVIGGALIVGLIGICTIVALGKASDIPKELWTTVSALGGGLLGLLAPEPAKSVATDETSRDDASKYNLWDKVKMLGRIALKDIWANRAVLILLIVFGIAVWLGATKPSTEFQALAGASGAALVGLLAPAPGASKDKATG